MDMHLIRALLIIMLPALGSSCTTKKPEQNTIDYKTEMMEADRDFSRLSEQKGMKYALMQYIDPKGVLLRPNTIPVIGVEAIDFISQGNDTSYTITWDPNGGAIAKSGELG